MLLLTLNTLTVTAGMTNTLLSRCTSANLGNNGIGAEGTAALSGALRQQSALRHLNLEINSLGDAGAEQLANWLASEAPPCKMRANKLSSLSEPLSLSLSLPMEPHSCLNPVSQALAPLSCCSALQQVMYLPTSSLHARCTSAPWQQADSSCQDLQRQHERRAEILF